METVGETERVPDVPPIVKLFPVQLVAFCEDQVRVEEFPWVMEGGAGMIEHCGPTAQLANVYVPERVPLEHERDCDVQLEP